MIEPRIEYKTQERLSDKAEWNSTWHVLSNLDDVRRKLQKFREWAELNNRSWQYRIIKVTITTEVLKD